MNEGYKPAIIITEPNGDVRRLVDPKQCMDWLGLVRAGMLTMEEAMRDLYPEEARKIYAVDLKLLEPGFYQGKLTK